MKNIYIVCSSLNLGGAEIQSVWLANKLVKKGYRVSYVVLKKSNYISTYLDKNINLIQYKMYAADSNKNLVKIRKLYNFFSGIVLFRKKIKKDNALVFSFLFHSNIFVFLSTLFTNKKHIICIRNDRFNSRNSTKNLKIRFFLIYIVSLFSYKIVFNSNKAHQTIGRKLPEKNRQTVILNSIADFKVPVDEEKYTDIKNFLKGSHNRFVSVGRLEPLKNYENILKAFMILKHKGIEFKYVIFGQGFLEDKLKNIISESNLEEDVILLGGIRGAKEYLDLFSYYILGSIHEGFPNSLIEAMSKGLIPFVTDAGDAFDIISQDRGVQIEDTRADQIAATIFGFLEKKDTKVNNDMLVNISSYLNTDLNQDNIINKWIDLIK